MSDSKNKVIYIVTFYGCDKSPSDMWIPESHLFFDYEEAYAYFLEMAPNLPKKSEDGAVKKARNEDKDDDKDKNKDEDEDDEDEEEEEEEEDDYDGNANSFYEGKEKDKVKQYISPHYPRVWQGYNIIENRVQNPDAFWRPEGAVFAVYMM